MNRTTYVYPGMQFITPVEALEYLHLGATVYVLNDDNSEGMLDDPKDIDLDRVYGLELTEFDFDRYLSNRVNENGEVLFSHGTDDVNILLDIAEEFLYFASQGGTLRQTMKDGAANMVNRIKKAKGEGDIFKANVWKCVATYIDMIAPFGWKFGPFENNGLDYVFKKEVA